MERLGVVMAPAPGDPHEAGGVLNPGCARGRDGDLYLFSRRVAAGNYSRIGRERVLFEDGVPVGVERLGLALEPSEAWERNSATAGVEDPRVTFLPALDVYVMTYSAYGPLGARIGLACSDDLVTWRRLGPVSFAYEGDLGTDLNLYSNKDAALFGDIVPDPQGRPSYALLHRPTWDLSWIRPGEGAPLPRGVSDPRPGIWVSFAPAGDVHGDLSRLARVACHRQVALPEQDWESLKVGAGPPPVRIEEGWLLVHHGVRGTLEPGTDHQPSVRYCAGAMVLDHDDVTRVVARTERPLLEPETPDETSGVVDEVVFPTAIDRLSDGSAHVYYGMADDKIGAARLRRSR
ncbi:MAG: glycoside hydrolase family 130 protein [Actinomycetota bacterium]